MRQDQEPRFVYLERYCKDCHERVEYVPQKREIEQKFGLTFYCRQDDENFSMKETLSREEKEAHERTKP